jgi:hypothetical protein
MWSGHCILLLRDAGCYVSTLYLAQLEHRERQKKTTKKFRMNLSASSCSQFRPKHAASKNSSNRHEAYPRAMARRAKDDRVSQRLKKSRARPAVGFPLSWCTAATCPRFNGHCRRFQGCYLILSLYLADWQNGKKYLAFSDKRRNPSLRSQILDAFIGFALWPLWPSGPSRE